MLGLVPEPGHSAVAGLTEAEVGVKMQTSTAVRANLTRLVIGSLGKRQVAKRKSAPPDGRSACQQGMFSRFCFPAVLLLFLFVSCHPFFPALCRVT